ncbi:Hypothetical predicted protein [Marmota monax]|uniref:Uncharacterized protein n=2 Tax=Marmota monax TaxID=9995 RepID=A0A5E4D5J1_MARMO|nr:uncharacterized protein LOC125619555 [Marmota marmota marmota]KAF7475401.1 hypothetical protein GHT09_013769 [Marmota monax]VTJ89484.1 Hypothetical predicted protein [Marmota monax]
MECNGHQTAGDNELGEPLNLPSWIHESLCPSKLPHGPWPLLCAGDAMSRQRFQYFLESLLQDQWLIPTISSIQDWFDAIDNLWLQGTFTDFTPTEVAVYSHWVLFLAAMISPDLPPEHSSTSLSRPHSAPTQQEAAGSDQRRPTS